MKIFADKLTDEHKTNIVMVDIKEFMRVADLQSTGQGINIEASEFVKKYRGKFKDLNIYISFGIGRATSIPWIALTGYGQKVQNGIYPVFLYYKDFNILILCYGISETNVPSMSWRHQIEVKTVRQYFEESGFTHPRKYGNSLIFKIYNKENISNEVILKDLEELIDKYQETMGGKIKNVQESVKKITQSKNKLNFDYKIFKKHASDSNLLLSDITITRFIASLLTKRFVILTGLSGSGKTKLAQTFAMWICENKKQYCIIPVGADWTSREPLLGYPNALKESEYVKPENGVLELIIEAHKNMSRPYFLILDEMNLSHVERYFADFLSVMESNHKISLHSGNIDWNGVPFEISFPKNLFIVGTVNIDETTYMFSPKVLDRANVIEFRVSSQEINEFLNNPKSIDLKGINGKGSQMAQNFIELSENNYTRNDDINEINETFLNFFKELKKLGAEFGYRSANEIIRLINQLGIIDHTMSINTKVDIAIMQKLLPKLHGSRRKLTPVLLKLGEFCIEKDKVEKIENDLFGKEEFDFSQDFVKYPISLEKLIRMYNGALENGFASYAEA